MKFLFDFFPILVFYVAYKIWDIYVATAAVIAATALQVAISWVRHRRIERMPLVALGLLLVLGGATIWFRDPLFLQWKVSVVNWLFGLVFIGSGFIGRAPLVERMMSHAVEAPAPVWRRLNWAWGLFFIGLGLLNLYVMRNFDEAAWVNFKVYGLLGLTVAFVVAQSFYLGRHMAGATGSATGSGTSKEDTGR